MSLGLGWFSGWCAGKLLVDRDVGFALFTTEELKKIESSIPTPKKWKHVPGLVPPLRVWAALNTWLPRGPRRLRCSSCISSHGRLRAECGGWHVGKLRTHNRCWVAQRNRAFCFFRLGIFDEIFRMHAGSAIWIYPNNQLANTVEWPEKMYSITHIWTRCSWVRSCLMSISLFFVGKFSSFIG